MVKKLRGEVQYHPNYEKYVEFIVNHPNYAGLFYERDDNGRVKWVVAGKSPKGQLRQSWWDNQCKIHNIPIQKGCYAKLARLIHPTGIHICQCCGEGRSIFYEYPAKTTVGILNKILGCNIDKDNDEERAQNTIREIIEQWCDSMEKAKAIAAAFGLRTPKDKDDLIELIYSEMVDKESSRFSPGVMCNPPDRFNGFHSYALCCRTKFDTGRHSENMMTYGQDRRAYEDWSDGDYNLANRLMGEFRKQPPMACPVCGNTEKMSADHIGPISLGFCHSRNFAPMCSGCNSSKNNRFTKSDVDELIKIEESGEQVISWHSKAIWDAVKHTIKNDIDAKFASSVMAKCHQNVLNILSIIYKKTGTEFLMRYLHPEYSLVDYRYLLHLENLKIISTPLDSKNKRKNQERYVRIAFDSLEEFSSKKNRKNYFLIDEDSKELDPIIASIALREYDKADKLLRQLIQSVSNSILEKETHERFFGYGEIDSPFSIAAEPE
ncbi:MULTISPECIES: restriction endonuclease [Bacteroidales]|jgi:Alw26I/Eco31I/Esp3I family type II restriction endonuclease|uniref:Restriction endonuclease n=2 Tax=Muribaculum TaxID=1918540 RepID=A0A4P7VNN0_9BACT|nr:MULTISPECIES: restriction endonuclease [Bacteroidales]QCD35465.1 restriction endonuclease [Muribaculum gordoncarteri]